MLEHNACLTPHMPLLYILPIPAFTIHLHPPPHFIVVSCNHPNQSISCTPHSTPLSQTHPTPSLPTLAPIHSPYCLSPHSPPSIPLSSAIGDFTVSLSCGTDSSNIDSTVWCMLFNDARCTCNTTAHLDVTISGLILQWNVSKSDVVINDGTLIGCFQEERLVSMVYTSGTGVHCCCMHWFSECVHLLTYVHVRV